MTDFSISFNNITKIEKEAIIKLISITYLPRFVKQFKSLKLSFQTEYGYSSFKSMYQYNDINKEAIKSLKKKGIILSMYNTDGVGSMGVFIYFTPNCNFHIDFSKRKVLIEKCVNVTPKT